MEKIYGYKEKDIISLAKFLKTRKCETLSATFESFGKSYGKAKGTVRNLYYALAKLSAIDSDFCEKYLGGTPISVNVVTEFGKSEEKNLLKTVLCGIKDGKSVRKCIAEMSDGDAKKSLRYQNKYRNILKNNPDLVAETVKEIKDETGETVKLKNEEPKIKDVLPEFRFERLKKEINGLVERISFKTKRENEFLKDRIKKLENENIRLSAMLYGGKRTSALKYFASGKSRDMLN